MRYLGIDYGTKKIGLAIGDDETRIATPLEIVEEENQQAFAAYLNTLIKREEIGTLVIGIPEFSKEQYGQHYEKVKAFSNSIQKNVTIPVIEVDESFTTKQAGHLLGAKARGRDDAVAAMLLVQQVLDRLA
ncbi:MAG: Holliday junction resolvase RuvX [Patescibacteria group bacterium]